MIVPVAVVVLFAFLIDPDSDDTSDFLIALPSSSGEGSRPPAMGAILVQWSSAHHDGCLSMEACWVKNIRLIMSFKQLNSTSIIQRLTRRRHWTTVTMQRWTPGTSTSQRLGRKLYVFSFISALISTCSQVKKIIITILCINISTRMDEILNQLRPCRKIQDKQAVHQ